jgi:DNA ligase-1
MDNEKNEITLLIQQLNTLGNLKGNQKLDYLKDQPLQKWLTMTLMFVFNKFIQTGISSKTLLNPDLETQVVPSDLTYLKLIDYVRAHHTGDKNTASLVKSYIQQFSDQNVQTTLIQIFSKELKLGITAKSINKVFGKNFIPEFDVQLAFHYAKYANKITNKRFILTQKLDGHRSVCIIKNGHGQFYTRQGLIIPGLETQAKNLVNFANQINQQEFVFDGELLLKNTDRLTTKDLFRKTSSVLRSNTADKSDIIFNIFDGLSLDEFINGKSNIMFADRKQTLISAKFITPQIKVIPNLYDGYDTNKIAEIVQQYVEPNDWEGLMLNTADGQYVTKRSQDILKIKKFFNTDVFVTDIFEGTGHLKNRIGGVIVDYKGFPVRVGSGFNDVQRKYFWEHPADIVNHLIDVQYFEETRNQKDESLSLRFPIFKTIRDDKNHVSFES